MSGTAALASARRRRAIPQKPEQNEVVEAPKQLSQQQQPQQQPLAANPMMLLLKHNQQLVAMQAEIEQLKKDVNIPKNKDDKENWYALDISIAACGIDEGNNEMYFCDEKSTKVIES